MTCGRYGTTRRLSKQDLVNALKLNLQLDTKQFLLHVLLVQAASPPPVQAAIPLLSLLDLAPLLLPVLTPPFRARGRSGLS